MDGSTCDKGLISYTVSTGCSIGFPRRRQFIVHFPVGTWCGWDKLIFAIMQTFWAVKEKRKIYDNEKDTLTHQDFL